jgi:hypothetical protein
MKFDESTLKIINQFRKDMTDSEIANKLGTVYWHTLLKNIKELIANNENIELFCRNEYDFINIGIIDSLFDNAKEVRYQLNKNTFSFNYLKVQVVTEWLNSIIDKIKGVVEADAISQSVKQISLQQKKIDKEISSIQEARKKLLIKEFTHNSDKIILSQIQELTHTDQRQLVYLQKKNIMAEGPVYSVEDRRLLAQQTKNIEKDLSKREMLYNQIKTPECKTLIRKYNTSINELFAKKVTLEKDTIKKEKELSEIKNTQSSLSAGELEERIISECKYLRDLIKLSANRLHIENCSILLSNKKFFTREKLYNCLERILEFDPKIFKNRKVEIHGRPGVLLVPGNGNGIYDWKNNNLVIPMFPVSGDFMVSVANSMIEYRLDVDEDKYILNSYQKLTENKNVKSHIALRSNLTKDYIKWMNSEYQGYKVLSKESRIWFEHEIAPNKNDIFCPPQYRPFETSPEKFRILLGTVEKRLAKKETKASKDDLFLAGILHFQQGKFMESLEYTERLVKEYPDFTFGFFNLGIICMKTHHKQNGIQSFREFIDKKSQSWWASVARDHLRRLEKN